jgi:hypothetical protein
MRQAAALEAMVNQERAGALALTGERLERELAEMRRLQGLLGELTGRELSRAHRLLADSEQELCRQLWNLIVQREALGLTHHDDVYEQYGIPRSVVPRPL